MALRHVDEIGPEMQHERSLDVAGVNAMAGIEGRIEARRQPEPAPLRGGDQHAEPHAQLAPDDADHIVVAAMRIDDDQLAQAGAMHALADLAPDTSQIVRRIRNRAGRAQMLVGFSDRLRGQEQYAELVGKSREHGTDHALGDRGVGHDRKMRAMLLGGGDRQDRKGGIGIESGELARLELRPETLEGHYAIACMSSACQCLSLPGFIRP